MPSLLRHNSIDSILSSPRYLWTLDLIHFQPFSRVILRSFLRQYVAIPSQPISLSPAHPGAKEPACKCLDGGPIQIGEYRRSKKYSTNTVKDQCHVDVTVKDPRMEDVHTPKQRPIFSKVR